MQFLSCLLLVSTLLTVTAVIRAEDSNVLGKEIAQPSFTSLNYEIKDLKINYHIIILVELWVLYPSVLLQKHSAA